MSDEYYGFSENTDHSGNGYNNEPSYQPNGVWQAPDQKPNKKKKKSGSGKKILGMIGCGVVFGLAAGLVFWGVVTATGVTKTKTAAVEAQNNASQVTEIPQTADSSDVVSDDSSADTTATEGTMTVSQIAANCIPSVVAITCKSTQEVQSWFGTQSYETEGAGSGIILQENDTELLIATNNHVVEDATDVSVCFNDDEDQVYAGAIKGTDANNDLAVVAVKLSDLSDTTKKSIKIATIGDSDSLTVGESVVCIGNALGYGQSVTSGIVSAKDREVTIDNTTTKLIQTDAAINPGNSGGAMFDMNGKLVGINSAKFASEEVEGMGYAIPISKAQDILNELMNRQTRSKVDESKRGYLGISCIDVSSEAAQMYNIPKGVYVKEVGKGGAAEEAGIKEGDIITKFDGLSIDDRDALISDLEYYAVGEKVEVVVQRAGDNGYEEKTVTVTLAKQVLSDSDSSSQSGNSGSNGNSQTPNGNGGSTNPYGSDNSGSSSDEDLFGDLFR